MRNDDSRGGPAPDTKGRILGWDNPSWWSLLATTPWAIGLLFILLSPRPYEKAEYRQQITHGIVRTHVPEDHNRCGYEFMVAGKTYSGQGTLQNGECQIGERVLVYYDPLDPTVNSRINFFDANNEGAGLPYMLAFAIAGFALFIFLQRRAYRSNLPRSSQIQTPRNAEAEIQRNH